MKKPSRGFQRGDFLRISGFYKLSVSERLKKIKEAANLSDNEVEILKNTGSLAVETADRMVENVVGGVHLPIGIATNFKINGKEYLVPMALEEPSVIAGASKAAKLTEGFAAEAEEPVMIGQIQLVGMKNAVVSIKKLEEKKKDIMKLCEQHLKNLEKYGGGIRSIFFRTLKTSRGDMVLAEFEVDMRDAMGANMMNTMLEAVAPTVAEFAGAETRLRIISNLATKRKVRVKAVWKKEKIGADAIEKILDGYELARNDIYRCATHNKGVMNGIDAVAVACGQDWRALEAGVHAYAALDGYRPVTHYEKNKKGDLVGLIEIPMAVATVGGAVNTLDTAGISLKILGVKSSQELGMVMAAVGLANNFAALYALSTEGIQKGHMKLHARNIAVLAGAKTPEEVDKVADELIKSNKYSSDFAKSVLDKMR